MAGLCDSIVSLQTSNLGPRRSNLPIALADVPKTPFIRDGGWRPGSDPTTWPGWQSRVVAFYVAVNTQAESAGQPIEDQSSATTVTAISAVPAHPKKVSVGRALKRPITERRVTTTIMTAMIGTATMPLSTALQISIWMGSIGV
jgi:hypothetical protein